MRRTANGRRIYALADYTVERTGKGWYSVARRAHDRARTPQRDRQTRRTNQTPRMTGEFFFAPPRCSSPLHISLKPPLARARDRWPITQSTSLHVLLFVHF